MKGAGIPWNPETMFKLGEAYELGRKLGAEIAAGISGRIAGYAPDHGVLAQVVHDAGDGDHLEIGSLFGGSAILAALVKQHYGRLGNVVCVDPMCGYYGKPDPFTGLVADIATFHENARKFGVGERLELFAATSQPWPIPRERKFVSALIDGDHSFEGALHDWDHAKRQTERYVVFDNYDRTTPGVREAVVTAFEDPEWRCVLVYGISAVMERVQ